jgi:hypothetical protein
VIGPVILAVLFAVLLAGLARAIVDRWRGKPWIMRPYFAREWSQRHMDNEPPAGAFERWLVEWQVTRIRAGRWIDRDYPENGRRSADERTWQRSAITSSYGQRKPEHWRIAPTIGS